MSAYNGIAKVYLQNNNIVKALEYSDKALNLTNSRLQGNQVVLNDFLFTKAKIFTKAGYYNEALAIVNAQSDKRLTEAYNKENPKKVGKVAKRTYAELVNLKAAILLNKGSYTSFDSIVALNEIWVKKQIGKRNFQYRNHLVNKGYRAKSKGDLKLAIKYFEAANKYTKFKPLSLIHI